MVTNMNNKENVASPCIGNCCLDDNDICLGCYRSLDEILAWQRSSTAERLVVLERIQTRKTSKNQ